MHLYFSNGCIHNQIRKLLRIQRLLYVPCTKKTSSYCNLNPLPLHNKRNDDMHPNQHGCTYPLHPFFKTHTHIRHTKAQNAKSTPKATNVVRTTPKNASQHHPNRKKPRKAKKHANEPSPSITWLGWGRNRRRRRRNCCGGSTHHRCCIWQSQLTSHDEQCGKLHGCPHYVVLGSVLSTSILTKHDTLGSFLCCTPQKKCEKKTQNTECVMYYTHQTQHK